jgi:hypothetical protein
VNITWTVRRYTSRLRPHWIQNPTQKINILQGLGHPEQSSRHTLPKSSMSQDFLHVLFIARAEPWAVGEMITLSPRSPGTCRRVWLKVMALLPCLTMSLSLAHQWCLSPAAESHGYSTPLIRGQFVIFWVAREFLTTVDPWPCYLRNTTKHDLVSEGSAPNLAPYDDGSTTFLYDLMTFICTRYALCPGAPAMALYVNGPIPISLYFCFLSRMVVGLIEDLPG